MNRHFAGKGCSSVQRCHYIAECRQTGAPTVPGKLEQNMAALDRDVVGHWRRHAATVGSARPWKRRRLPRTTTRRRPKETRRRRGGATALRCACAGHSERRRHPKEALERGAAPTRKRGRRPPAEAPACTRHCDLRRRRPPPRRRAGCACWALWWTVNGTPSTPDGISFTVRAPGHLNRQIAFVWLGSLKY